MELKIEVCFIILGKQSSKVQYETPTKWEISLKILFPSYNQIHVVQTLKL